MLNDTESLRDFAVPGMRASLSHVTRFASAIKDLWRNGEKPDTASVLTKYPEIIKYRSVVLDLAVEEFKCRQASGENLDSEKFVQNFPSLSRSLYMLIEVQRMLQQYSIGASPGSDITWPEPENIFLGFSLIAELGRGTFGRVFLATEPSLGNRLVALKVAPQGQCEAEILGKLRHSNIVPVYSVQEDPETGLTAVCMPYLGHITLQDVIERAYINGTSPIHGRFLLNMLLELSDVEQFSIDNKIDKKLIKGSYEDAIIHIAIQISDALSFTHAKGICHNDLKPSNVLLSHIGCPLLLDFNLSLEYQISATRIGGTLPYMAPEQIQCLLMEHPTDCLANSRSDLYSLGVILYELLTGKLPYSSIHWKGGLEKVAADLLDQQKQGTCPLQELNPNVDRQLASIVESCLEYDPQSRPESAEILAKLLRKQTSISRRTIRWIRRHRLKSVGISVFLVVICFIFGLWFSFRDPYPIRLYKQGVNEFQSGNSELALENFNEASHFLPKNIEIILARAKTYHRLGKYQEAFKDYDYIYQSKPSGEIAALEGHCLSKMKYHKEAVDKYLQAMRTGYSTFSLMNNIGYSLIQLEQLTEAEVYLRKAIDLDPHSMNAWQNLIKIAIKRANRNSLSEQDLVDLIKKSLNANDIPPEMFIDLAVLESHIAERNPIFVPKVYEYLQQAIGLGAAPQDIARNPCFNYLQNRPDFITLVKQKSKVKPSQASLGLVFPL